MKKNNLDQKAEDCLKIVKEQRQELQTALENQKKLIQAIIKDLPAGVIVRDTTGTVLMTNPAANEIMGVSLTGSVFEPDSRYSLHKIDGSLYPPGDLPLPRTMATGNTIENVEIIVRVQDKETIISVSTNPLKDANGNITGAVAIIRDITHRKQMEEALRESVERFRNAFDYAAIGMVLANPDGRFFQLNGRFCDIVGYTEQELLSMTFKDISHPEDMEIGQENINKLLKGEIPYFHLEKRYIHKKGHTVWVLLSTSVVRDSKGIPSYFIGQIQDITDRKIAEERLLILSQKDPLTGLYNRYYFEQCMREFQNELFFPLGIIICDLDGLKAINDTLGHNIGDKLLAAAAQVLRISFRSGDIIARIGGDEFAILLPNKDMATLEKAYRRIHRAVNNFNKANNDLFLSLSVGYALGEKLHAIISDVFKAADNNMYQEKSKHRQKYQKQMASFLEKHPKNYSS